MRIKRTLLLLLIIFFSCKEKKPKQVFTLPNNNDINEIVEAIIYQDSLPVFKSIRQTDTIISANGHDFILSPINFPLAVDLRKITVFIPDTNSKDNMPPPPSFNGVYINQLFDLEVNDNKVFNAKDSLYFL